MNMWPHHSTNRRANHIADIIKKAAVIICSITGGLALIFASSACGAADSTANNNLRKTTFMLSWAPDTNHIGVYVAKSMGWFAKAGLDVDIVAVAQAGAEQAVNNGVADFALSNLTNVGVYSVKGAHLTQVLQVQQKTSAIWCSLASNTSVTGPKDFDGKTFATFGSSESDAVIKRMIQTDGGAGDFDKVTVGTSTFQTLSSGKADFGGFYATWEGVQADMYGPALNCFTEPDYGVPGNADTIGIITSDDTIKNDPGLVESFTQAAQRGYEYAYAHPDKAAKILVQEAADANLDLEFVKRSMQVIVDGEYWGSRSAIENGSFILGTANPESAQEYFDFLAQEDAYTDASGEIVHKAPQASSLSTDEFLSAKSAF